VSVCRPREPERLEDAAVAEGVEFLVRRGREDAEAGLLQGLCEPTDQFKERLAVRLEAFLPLEVGMRVAGTIGHVAVRNPN